MVLVFTSDEDATADHLCDRLTTDAVPFVRLDTDDLLARTTVGYANGAPYLWFDGRRYQPADFSNIWYRRPEALKDARFGDTPEDRFALGEWSEALEGFFSHIPIGRWMNHPSANFAASHKIEQLTTARSLGLIVPNTVVTQDPVELALFFDQCEGRMIAKPLSVGYIDRLPDELDSLIYTNRVLPKDILDEESVRACPTLFQEYINKDADYRITIVDEDIHTAKLIAKESDGSQRCDVRRNSMVDVAYERVQLPDTIETALLQFMRRYRLRFGAIDMAKTMEGDWVFFEINPNGQWAWLDIASSFDIAASFVRSFGGRRS